MSSQASPQAAAGRSSLAALGAWAPGRLRAATVLLVVLLAALASPAFAADPTFPPLTGRVVDQAGILDAATKAALERKLAALEQTSSDQLVVATLASLQGLDIADYGYRLGRAWGIGQGKLNNGVLLIVAPSEHKLRIEVGYGLEGTLTDALSSVVIQQAILPKFRAGDMPAGIGAGVDAIVSILTGDEAEWKKRAEEGARRPDTFSASDAMVLIFVVFIVLIFLGSAFRRDMSAPGAGLGTRRRGGMPPIIFPPSGGFGGGSGGGGFSGGGGSFGGGGSSGSW